MVLAYYGVNKSERILGKMTRCTLEDGTETKNIVRTARQLGFAAFSQEHTTVEELHHWLRLGVPPIVGWFSTDVGHYSVVIGINHRFVYLQDPERGKKRRMWIPVFLRVWFGLRNEIPKSKHDLVIRRMIIIRPKRKKNRP